jgi:hypothetical protein
MGHAAALSRRRHAKQALKEMIAAARPEETRRRLFAQWFERMEKSSRRENGVVSCGDGLRMRRRPIDAPFRLD